MNAFKSPFPVLVLLAGSVLAALPAQAASTSCATVTPVQRRIVERADQGDIDSLRGFVGVMAYVHGIDMVDVRDHLDAWRAAVACHKQLAEAQAAAPVAATESTPASAAPTAATVALVSPR
jgi:hypothetical protein